MSGDGISTQLQKDVGSLQQAAAKLHKDFSQWGAKLNDGLKELKIEFKGELKLELRDLKDGLWGRDQVRNAGFVGTVFGPTIYFRCRWTIICSCSCRHNSGMLPGADVKPSGLALSAQACFQRNVSLRARHLVPRCIINGIGSFERSACFRWIIVYSYPYIVHRAMFLVLNALLLNC
ncbi:hypothetical protein PVK06_033848 [Gossypium arboreum]|uniref:Uncharacterized protein n=1 Tax=Gossypium arboreum TaxID=29729 RepID=A0ABR0NCX2_GOSAR|nr:hypothetical protein PVK06_033848 [Gossypium arboreum]